jgi:N-acetyl-alpha-D-glucosaminyl L-malate synthase BshA
MHISNFRPVKRVTDVVEVFARILNKMPAKMLFVGDGPDRYAAEQLCRKLGTCKHTSFLGKVKDVKEILILADLFILPSETESFGLSALEAMISKVPVISTNTGGLPEVNENGKSGFMSNVGDVDDMSKNAIQILENDETLNRFKEGAFQRALEFDIDKILPLYEDLYSRTLASIKVE